ncbi:MAG: CDP-alcohol phosphatidyltransferase family protein [Bernardetiaceae bacterium]
MKKEIPNLLTLSNLLCGCLGIWQIHTGNSRYALYALGASLVFDFLDGAVARALRVSSPLGKELDSLADMVSFGVMPGLLVFVYLDARLGAMWAQVAWLIPLLSAYRLAQFNIDTAQSEHFLGLPTPAHAAFWVPLPWLAEGLVPVGLVFGASLVMPVLLVLRFPLFSLKFKRFSWQDNEIRWVFLLLLVGTLALGGIAWIPPLVVAYVLLSLVFPPDRSA